MPDVYLNLFLAHMLTLDECELVVTVSLSQHSAVSFDGEGSGKEPLGFDTFLYQYQFFSIPGMAHLSI
jgi:hypothetical protein